VNAKTDVRALIAEDEAPQREALLQLLQEVWPEVWVESVCEDGVSAIEAVVRTRPTVAFLDVRLPGVSGLDVARAAVASGSLVVFTTAYNEYAVKAFEAGATDYLLKPFLSERFRLAVERLKKRLLAPPELSPPAWISTLEMALRPSASQLLRWVSVSLGNTVKMLSIDEVLFFQAQDKYIRVVTAHTDALIRTPLKQLLAQIDSDVFWQVHRGVVVRVAAIDSCQKDELGRAHLTLKGHAERLPVSTPFLNRFRGM
jgi:DNA-binding LytR/AlgR family response regulator